MLNSTPIPPFLLEFEDLWTEPDARSALSAALTRKAWLREQGSASPRHHEPLEWLGDRMLEAVVAQELWRRFPYADEKKLDAVRKVLCGETLLTQIAEGLGVHPHIRQGRGEALQGQVQAGKGLSDHVEAILGAAFLAGGLAGVDALVQAWWAPHWPERLDLEEEDVHPSSELNVLVTRIWREPLPKKSWWFDGDGPFRATVTLPDGTAYTGDWLPKKQDAKGSAAAAALPYLREHPAGGHGS